MNGCRLKILYTTDLHGSNLYYNMTFKKAMLHEVDLVINGGDLLPKIEPIFRRQKKYIRFLEKMYFPRWEKAGIYYIYCPGNDDARIFDDDLAQACSRFDFVHFLKRRKIEIRGLDFIDFDLVCDYPFGIKDRCRMDRQDFIFPDQTGPPSYTVKKAHGEAWEEIEDWFSVARTLPTLEEELQALVRPRDMKKAVYIMHMPPAGIGLDACQADDRPESKSVFEFLAKNQPLLSLHGHIHESYQMTGIWKTKIGDTWAVQPGQGGQYPVYCVIDTDDLENMERYGR